MTAPTNNRARALAFVTAGPTEEPIDAVRFIGNRSSGRMGVALANALLSRGFDVVLALGPVRGQLPVASPPPIAGDGRAGAPRLRLERFCSSSDLERLMRAELPAADLVVLAAAVADFLAAQNLPTSFVMAPHPEFRALPWSNRPLLDIREGRAQATDLVSVQHAFVGIAETGTLMLPSAPERPTTLNLLADTEIVVLRASRLVGAYEEAWDLLRADMGGMPRNVMLVTGPSRSADIEQTLELGAHGPRQLHVVLVEDAG
jgi:hypothetical protein